MAGFLQQLGVKTATETANNPINLAKAGMILLAVFVFILIGVITFIVVWNNYQKKRYNEILFMIDKIP